VHYDEELLVGYRHFDKHGIKPLFPFGHGLSYTRFGYCDLHLTSDSVSPGDSLEVSFDLVNEGDRAGAEVVQLYLADLQSEPDRPAQALKAFAKIPLAPGERRPVSFTLTHADFAIFEPETGEWQARQGAYEIRVGSSSRDIRLRQGVSLAATTTVSAGAGS